MTDVAAAREIAAAVADPELPMLTLADLGILRDVTSEDGHIVVTITPTYSGCPALREIACDLEYRLTGAGFAGAAVRTQIAPGLDQRLDHPGGPPEAAGRRHRASPAATAAGAAPPGPVPLNLTPAPRGRVTCPQCGSSDTAQTSAFGATACKALLRCNTCHEPFEMVKEF